MKQCDFSHVTTFYFYASLASDNYEAWITLLFVVLSVSSSESNWSEAK